LIVFNIFSFYTYYQKYPFINKIISQQTTMCSCQY